MGKQPSLFDLDEPPGPGAYGSRARNLPPAPSSNPTTSKTAALAIVGDLNRLQRVVYEFIVSRGEYGATNEEIQDGTSLSGDTVRPRCVRLRELGLVGDSGRKRTLRSGLLGIAWVAADHMPKAEDES